MKNHRDSFDVIALAFVVYFIQGALGIASIALALCLRSAGFSIGEIAQIISISSAPWFFKILYGLISDAVPVFGLRRKPYLVIFSLISASGWIRLAVCGSGYWDFIFPLLLANLGLAAVDVITDGYVVEHSTRERAGLFQGISWGARSIGALVAGVSGGILAARVDYRLIFLMTGCLPMISCIAAFFIREHPEKRDVSESRTTKTHLVDTFRKSVKRILRPDYLLFLGVFFLAACPVAAGIPMFFYLREHLGFDEIYLGILQSVAWLGAVAGCLIYLSAFKTVSWRKAIGLALVLNAAHTLLFLLIHDRLSAGVLFLTGGVFGYIALLPLMSVSARLAHGTGQESTLFAISASVYNIGQAFFQAIGGQGFHVFGLRTLIVLTAVVSLLPLALVRYLTLPDEKHG